MHSPIAIYFQAKDNKEKKEIWRLGRIAELACANPKK